MAYIIAEIGFNHGGNVNLAVKMVESAASAGANAVKFQSFLASDLYLPDNENYALFKAGELSEEDHLLLRRVAEDNKVDFLSTPFSVKWANFLDKLNPAGFKVASMDLNNPVLLKAVAQKGRKVYLSTGASSFLEVKSSLEYLKKWGADDVCVFHCVSNYPTKPEDACLSRIPEMIDELKVQVGFSDHTLGIYTPLAAVAMGAEVIEKHFTIDKSLNGPDHAISIDPAELKELVSAVQDVEKAVKPNEQIARPDDNKRAVMRRGIYAGKDIAQGEIITIESLKLVRPEVVPLEELEKIESKPAVRPYKRNDPLKQVL
ncbi:N-acetylneuraminate synthase [hydrothermal vent metagenome]|uniref:N-acetylneuraminate synthase n=1 Tax=hydrothermal vent metagenome TaxID=652676 RepID=A0A3B1CEK0_9ZZZZ